MVWSWPYTPPFFQVSLFGTPAQRDRNAMQVPASPEIQDEARGETLSVVVVDHDGSAVGQNSYLLGMKKNTWDLFKVGFSRKYRGN